MSRSLRLLPLCLAALWTGCAEIRSSSRDTLPDPQAEAVLLGSEAQALQRVTETLRRRGFVLVDRQARRPGGNTYVFRGLRDPSTGVPEALRGGSRDTLGSILYVWLGTGVAGRTPLAMFGKPTLSGRPVCSDADPEWRLGRCPERVVKGMRWEGRRWMTGREEAEVIRGVLLELELPPADGVAALVRETPSAFARPTPRPVRCRAEELPEWQHASAAQKRQLLQHCRQTAVPEEPLAGATP